MKRTLITIIFMASLSAASSQMQTIQMDPGQLHFDNGRPLPSEEGFFVNLPIEPKISMVKMQIAKTDFERRILYEGTWIGRENDPAGTAAIPNYFILRSNDNYNLRFLYYRKVDNDERDQIREMLNTSVNSFIQLNMQEKNDRYVMLTSPTAMYNSLNTLLAEGMARYEVSAGSSLPKFSGMIESMLRTMAGKRINASTSVEGADDSLELLLRQLNNEINMIANNYEYTQTDVVTIWNYPTEKKMNTLALNLGYAGIYESGSFSDLNYFSSPYAGISLPLGNRVFAGNFWSNTHISTGIFFNNFESSNGNIVSGPVIGRPIYAGLGYRAFRFLKVQAGATLLEESNLAKDSKSIYFAPFLGLSIELNVWVGLGK